MLSKLLGNEFKFCLSKPKKLRRTDPKLATQYVVSARKIAMAAKIRLPVEFRRETCKECNRLFVQALIAVLG